jgi:hypothetical protein
LIEHVDDMPPGTLGLRARGKLTKADYRDMLEPALREALESDDVRLLFVLTGFQGLEPGIGPRGVFPRHDVSRALLRCCRSAASR